MKSFLAITKALSDESRLRSLLALREGELCLCQIIALLGLSPSTVSKHMDILHQAGLVQRRKEGRWHHFRLSGREGTPAVRQATRWVMQTLADEPTIAADTQKLCCVRKQDLEEVSACYRAN
ncbi:MAG: winged helix-turn-helix transcriptional regulator [Phycisphaeraceae bacterium]|nr:winged helix-turn-helix transcriptional regulator [Phycisphaeraceae bacterium]